MSLPVIFSNQTAPQLSWLDQDFAALGALTPIPCVVSGTNSLSLAPLSNTPTITTYSNYLMVSGVFAASNTASMTAAVLGLALLPVYKDTASGPVVLTGGEAIAGNFFILAYDSTLNSGVGGFHLYVSTSATATYAVTSGTNATGTWPISISGAAATVTSVTGTQINTALGYTAANPASVLPNTAITSSVTSSIGATYTVATLTNALGGKGIILRQGSPGGGITDTTDTAANIVTLITGAAVNQSFAFKVVNSSGQTVTLGAGAGVTIYGSSTTANGASHTYDAVITNVGTGTQAVAIYG